jgi:hypothetical protein
MDNNKIYSTFMYPYLLLKLGFLDLSRRPMSQCPKTYAGKDSKAAAGFGREKWSDRLTIDKENCTWVSYMPHTFPELDTEMLNISVTLPQLCLVSGFSPTETKIATSAGPPPQEE